MKAIFVVLVTLSSSAFAQDSTVYFYDEQGETTVDVDEAFTYRIVVSRGSLLYIRHYVASNDQLILEGTYSRIGSTLQREGSYRSFYENGKIRSDGKFSKDKKVGLWKEYYANGQQSDEQFRDGDKFAYRQHWDEAGNPMLNNGTGKFTAGRRHFEVIDSIVFAEFTVDSLSSDSVYVIVPENAKYQGIFLAEIAKDLKYPKLARQYRVQGIVLVEFVVDKTGMIHSVKVIEGIGSGCDEAAVEAVKKRTKWIPGKVRGKAVNQWMVQRIAFTIK